MENIWLWLKTFDQWLFIYINSFWTNSFLDSLFPVWRDSTAWVPVYLFLLLFVVFNFGWKAFPWVCLFIITVSVCDQVSSNFIKDLVARPRPCRDPYFSQYVRLLLNRCPVSGSFTSSHATNHFGMSVFIALTFKRFIRNWKYLLYFWAGTISYGQVYVGVHYPMDVVGGGILGALIGWASASFFNRRIGLLNINPATEHKDIRLEPENT
jgi:undecaprenyl-diphosphatase